MLEGNVLVLLKLFHLLQHDNEDALADLKEMQCMWFTQESGLAHLRLQNYGKALKKFHQINQHFVDIYDDQFDFHVYCLRKSTFRDYVKLIRLEDRIKGHAFWVRSSIAAIRCYLEVISRASIEGADMEGDKENDECKKRLVFRQSVMFLFNQIFLI